jgi:O-methyltransferase
MASLINEALLAALKELAARTPRGGAFVEVGVYQGGSAAVLHDLALEQGRTLYLFDTFSGMPLQGPLDRHKVGEFADTSVELVGNLCPTAVICAGVFPDSLIETGPIAFVHADADQYESTRAICEHLAPRMVRNGVMLFDDYPFLEGCVAAVNEAFADDPGIQRMPDGRAFVRF